eukprot:68745_1
MSHKADSSLGIEMVEEHINNAYSSVPVPITKNDAMFTTDSTPSTNIDETTLRSLHEEQLFNGSCNETNTMDLVQILGGIDDILKTYLDHPDITLNPTQMHKIHQIISKPQQRSSITTKPTSNGIPLEDTKDRLYVEIEVDPDDNYLTTLCASNTSKIRKLIEHKVHVFFLTISIICYAILFAGPSHIDMLYFVVISLCWWIPLQIFLLLSINRKLFGFIRSSFDFWVKSGYAVVFIVTGTWYPWKVAQNEIHIVILYLFSVLSPISIISLVPLIGAFDGIHGMRYVKIFAPGCVSFLYLFISFRWEFMIYSYPDPSVVTVPGDIKISLLSIGATATRVMGIFFVKQTYSALKNVKNEGVYATSFGVKPRLIWKSKGAKGKEVTEKVQVINTQNTIY